jgi:hypothetical protein
MKTKLLTPLLLSWLLFVAADNAFGQFDANIWYRIAAKHSGKCLTAPVGTSLSGNGVLPVIEQDCSESGANQMWQVLSADDGYYRIMARQQNGKVLSVYGGIVSQGDGAVVQLWTYNRGWNQMWSFLCIGDGSYQIVARHSGIVLDINLGTDPAPYAQQWRNLHGGNQEFRFQPFEAGDSYPNTTAATCPSETAARITFNLYATDNGVHRLTRPARVNQTIALNFENNTGAPIYWNYGGAPELLFRETGLQVERFDGRTWFPVLPSGQCSEETTDPYEARTSVALPPLTQLVALGVRMNSTLLWTAPAALGPGTYRLSLAYYRSRTTRGITPSFVCSSPFEVR